MNADIEYKLFEYAEGLLDAKEMQEVENMLLKSPELQDELDLFLMTKVVPTEVMYTNKASLKKKATVVPLWFASIATYKVAAAIALFAIAYPAWKFFGTNTDSNNPVEIAAIKSNIQPINTEITDTIEIEQVKVVSIADNENDTKTYVSPIPKLTKEIEISIPNKEVTDTTATQSMPVYAHTNLKKSPSFEVNNQRNLEMAFVELVPQAQTNETESTHWAKRLKNNIFGSAENMKNTIVSSKIQVKRIDKETDPKIAIELTNNKYQVLAQINIR